MKRVLKIIFFLALFASLPWGRAFALDWPPSGGKPLSEIAAILEKREMGAIFETEFDDGLWEIKIYAERERIKLYIDPFSGKIVRQKKKADSFI